MDMFILSVLLHAHVLSVASVYIALTEGVFSINPLVVIVGAILFNVGCAPFTLRRVRTEFHDVPLLSIRTAIVAIGILAAIIVNFAIGLHYLRRDLTDLLNA